MRKLALRFTVALHLIFVGVILACFPLALLYPPSHKLILWFIAIVLLLQLPYRKCILTHIENVLRDNAYHGNFIAYYLDRFFGLKVSSRAVDIISGIYFIVLILVSVFYKLHQGFGKAHPGIY